MLAIKKSTIHCVWECKYEYSMERLSKIKHKLAIPLLDNFLKKTKTLIEKDICSPMCITALFTTAKIRKNLCSSLDEWIKKM